MSVPFPSPTAGSAPTLMAFTNCQLCIAGELIPQDLYFSPETGLITPNYYYRAEGVQRVDLGGRVVSAGFLDLQTNGMRGVHFTQLGTDGERKGDGDEGRLESVSRMEVECGVTGWWATVPTVARERWKEILPILRPRAFPSGADLLGAHCEGPYLHPSKKGAHNDAHFQKPPDISPSSLYGDDNLENVIKMITIAPELPGSIALIGQLQEEYPHISVSLGHSSATYEEGLAAQQVGAKSLTHTFNAMAPLQHRAPGLAGLMSTGKCYYSIIPDGIHLHPSILSLAFRTNPTKCMLITDSIELAGLPDGVHLGHGQIPRPQRKQGNKVTIEGTDVLIGSCCTLDQCVRNMVTMAGCSLAEAVQCATENIANMMGERKRGMLEPGRRADFVVMDEHGMVIETWMAGTRVWEKEVS